MGDGTVAKVRESLVNLRDVGGLRTETGARVVAGVLYRSEAPQHGDVAPATVPEWPVRTVIDLRSVGEIDAEHPLRATGAEVHHLPLTVALAPATAARALDSIDVVSLYLGLARDSREQLARIVNTVAREPGPVLVHCAAGKDRTGIVIAILLRLVGVRRDDLMADYERTSSRLPELWQRLVQAGMRMPADHSMLEVVPDALTAVLDLVESGPDGIESWLGVHSDTRRLLRRRLLAS